MGADETQRLVRPLVLPTAMLPCATPPPQQARWLARLQPPLPHTPLGARSLPAARQLRVGAAPGRIALGGHRRELARCNQQVRARRPLYAVSSADYTMVSMSSSRALTLTLALALTLTLTLTR